MPTHFYYFDQYDPTRRMRAEQQVRAKFPNIIVGSSGWYRAIANRLRRRP